MPLQPVPLCNQPQGTIFSPCSQRFCWLFYYEDCGLANLPNVWPKLKEEGFINMEDWDAVTDEMIIQWGWKVGEKIAWKRAKNKQFKCTKQQLEGSGSNKNVFMGENTGYSDRVIINGGTSSVCKKGDKCEADSKKNVFIGDNKGFNFQGDRVGIA